MDPVVVVGGGATGVGVARDLAMRGVDVRLVERGTLGAATTGHTHGVLHSGARYADEDPEGARECIAENRLLRDIAGACIEDTGGLFVSTPADDPDYLAEKRAACADCGIPTTDLTGDEAHEREPSLGAVEAALAVPDGVVSPSRLVAATAASAQAHGARVHDRTAVTDLLVEDGRVVAVELDRDGERRRVRAGHVVNAAGAWAGDLADLADVEVSMRPSRGAMAVVNHGVDPVLNRCRPTDDGDIVVPVGGRSVLGTTSEDVTDPDEHTFEHEGPQGRDDAESAAVERLVEECSAMVPAVAEATVERVYWGVRPLYAGVGRGRGASRGFQLFDHADRDDLGGLTTVTGGKLTTHRLMAEAVADHVAARLGVVARSRTAEERLPFADDREGLDDLVRSFGVEGPADRDAVAGD
jgi:glycerol-3-phosphate dehydrogenase